MHLSYFRAINCFGFGDAAADLHPPLIYVLGRNSSGKTSLLDAIDQLSPGRTPEAHPRFQNFRPTEQTPQLIGRFEVFEPPPFNAGATLVSCHA